MRFLEAVLLTDMNRAAEATAVLEKLIEEYPDLAEPHNNLAVLYAAAGRYARARSELEEALRLRPGYAVAHENLGDVYAALAAQSYATAQRLEPDRAAIPAKLALVRQLTTATRGATSPPAAASAASR
jgi:tetratricopeptide (TPR) repeat protein